MKISHNYHKLHPKLNKNKEFRGNYRKKRRFSGRLSVGKAKYFIFGEKQGSGKYTEQRHYLNPILLR